MVLSLSNSTSVSIHQLLPVKNLFGALAQQSNDYYTTARHDPQVRLVYDITMLDHHIQRAIVTKLTSAKSLTFSDLKPDDLDNKLFTYHLKIAIREGFVEKADDGTYRLTSAGQKLWRRMSESPEKISERAFSVLFLIIRDSAGRWLLYRRKTHPVIGKRAFMHSIPNSEMNVVVSAEQDTKAKTGLECSFKVIGSGFFRTYDGQNLVNFTNFTVLLSTDAVGELTPRDEFADYSWVDSPDFSTPDMLPNMQILHEAYTAGNYPFYIEETLQISGK